MAFGQSIVLVLEVICVQLNTPRASVGGVFLVFAYEACFTWGWSFYPFVFVFSSDAFT